VIAGTDQRRARGLSRGVVLLPAVIIVVGVVLAPLVALFIGSIADIQSAHGLTDRNYVRFFSDPFFLGVLWRTYRVAAVATLIALVIGWPIAYQLSRTKGRARLYLTLVILVPLLISVVVRAYGWVVILGPHGLVNNTLQGLGLTDGPLALLFNETAVIIGCVHTFLPLMILPIASALDNIDPSLLRAANNLGASPAQVFARVLLPLSIPGVLAGSVITFGLCASAYVIPALLGGSRLKFMSTLIFQYNIVVLDWTFGGALSVILVAFTLALVTIYSRLVERLLFRGAFQR
jgi:putative spermidine/putrescine transport system permease protein